MKDRESEYQKRHARDEVKRARQRPDAAINTIQTQLDADYAATIAGKTPSSTSED